MYPRQSAEPVDHASRAAHRLNAVAISLSLSRVYAGAQSAQWRFPGLGVTRSSAPYFPESHIWIATGKYVHPDCPGTWTSVAGRRCLNHDSHPIAGPRRPAAISTAAKKHHVMIEWLKNGAGECTPKAVKWATIPSGRQHRELHNRYGCISFVWSKSHSLS